MKDSKIEWCQHTFSPWRGCSRTSTGCKFCYAETLSHRNPAVLGIWGDKGTRVVAAESAWRQPLKWDRLAKAAGEKHRVFCSSLADVFEDRPELVAPRIRLFDLIEQTENLNWLLLTKRIDVWRKVMRDTIDGIPRNDPMGRGGLRWKLVDWLQGGQPSGMPHRPNIWLGTSVENQETADHRIPYLLDIPAKVRFLSMEPLLGSVDLRGITIQSEEGPGRINPLAGTCIGGGSPHTQSYGSKIDWVIVGGESGPNARPMNPEWAKSIRDQCISTGVPFHFKQHGEWGEGFDGMGRRESYQFRQTGWDGVEPIVYRIGKKNAGRMLDGREWNEFPTPNK